MPGYIQPLFVFMSDSPRSNTHRIYICSLWHRVESHSEITWHI